MGCKDYLTQDGEQREAIIEMLFANDCGQGMFIECLAD
jgi:hypothetical protein